MKKINCILLIDDNAFDNEFHTIVMKKADVCHQIRIAEDGVKGLEYIMDSAKQGNENDKPKPDLIFLDINMPRMNGFEFLEEYQKLDEKITADAVICMLTTSLDPDDQKRALNYKAITAFQNKPINIKTLQEMVDKYF